MFRVKVFFSVHSDLLKSDNPMLDPEILLIQTAYLSHSKAFTFAQPFVQNMVSLLDLENNIKLFKYS